MGHLRRSVAVGCAMVSSPCLKPSVVEVLALATGVVMQTQRRIDASIEADHRQRALARKTWEALRLSYEGIASRSDPFTVDKIGVSRSE